MSFSRTVCRRKLRRLFDEVVYADHNILLPILAWGSWTCPLAMAMWFSVVFSCAYILLAIPFVIRLWRGGWLDSRISLELILGVVVVGLFRANMSLATVFHKKRMARRRFYPT